jgi:hypothetical protein
MVARERGGQLRTARGCQAHWEMRRCAAASNSGSRKPWSYFREWSFERAGDWSRRQRVFQYSAGR